LTAISYINVEVREKLSNPKPQPQQVIFERERESEIDGRDREIQRKDREIEGKDRDTEK
jgi:hypothetical protein